VFYWQYVLVTAISSARNRYLENSQLAAKAGKALKNHLRPHVGHAKPGNSEVESVNDPYNSPGGGYPGPQGGYPGGPQGGYPGGGYSGPGYPAGGGYQGGYAPQQDFQQRGYLQGGPVDFQGAIRQQIDNVLNFNGRASRSAYWWYALAMIIVDVVLEIFAAVVGSSALTLLIGLVILVVGLSGLSVAVRRMHDQDKSGWMLLLGLIPFIGGIIVLIFMCLPGTPGQNRFG
jgi:uncharacterized membrane protein YhaH (DUF805 family)